MNSIFPEIQFHADFKDFEKDPYFQALQFVKGSNPGYKTDYVSNEASNILKYKQLSVFSNLLNKSGFSKFMPVKGMYLLNNLFSPFPGIRQMADIDILMHPDEFKKIPVFIKKHPEIELKSNFHPALRRFFAEDFSFVFNDTVIELHSEITLVSFPGFVKEMFEHSTLIKNPDKMVFLTPEIEYMTTLMLLHDYARNDFSDLNCKRLLEFYLVLGQCDFEKLFRITKKYGLDKMLDCHLFILYTIIKTPFFKRSDFSIDVSFGYIEKHPRYNSFIVADPLKLRKVLYGKRWKYLRTRNLAAETFKLFFSR